MTSNSSEKVNSTKEVKANGTEATAKNSTPAAPETLDDTISKVFDEMHQPTLNLLNNKSEDTAEGSGEGFIGKHLKKLKEKEELKKR